MVLVALERMADLVSFYPIQSYLIAPQSLGVHKKRPRRREKKRRERKEGFQIIGIESKQLAMLVVGGCLLSAVCCLLFVVCRLSFVGRTITPPSKTSPLALQTHHPNPLIEKSNNLDLQAPPHHPRHKTQESTSAAERDGTWYTTVSPTYATLPTIL